MSQPDMRHDAEKESVTREELNCHCTTVRNWFSIKRVPITFGTSFAMQVQFGCRRHGVTAFYVMSCVVTGRLLNFRTRRDVMDASCMMALMYNEWCALSHISSVTSVTPRAGRELPTVVIILQLAKYFELCCDYMASVVDTSQYSDTSANEWSWQRIFRLTKILFAVFLDSANECFSGCAR